MIDNIDFGEGNVVFNDLIIDKNEPLSMQLESLKEDLLQVNYSNKYILDIGWYPEFDIEGQFTISVIADYNWEKPLLLKECNTVEKLEKDINQCIYFINSID